MAHTDTRMDRMPAETPIDVRLHGRLAQKYGAAFSFIAACPADAVKALSSNFDGFAEDFRDGSYRFVSGGEDLDENGCWMSFGKRKTLDIIPVPEGAGGGMGKVVAGAALIAASVFLPPLAGGAAWAAALGHAGMALGVSMALSGVSQMLAKSPASSYENKSSDTKTSTLYDGPVNSSGQGLAIPLPYGEILAGSIVASAGITTEKIL